MIKLRPSLGAPESLAPPILTQTPPGSSHLDPFISPGENLATCLQGQAEDVMTASVAAKTAFHNWSRLPGASRAQYLTR